MSNFIIIAANCCQDSYLVYSFYVFILILLFYSSILCVFRLDLATLQWEAMSALEVARVYHACCAVRGSLVVIGGNIWSNEVIGSVEMFAEGGVESRSQINRLCHAAG